MLSPSLKVTFLGSHFLEFLHKNFLNAGLSMNPFVMSTSSSSHGVASLSSPAKAPKGMYVSCLLSLLESIKCLLFTAMHIK